MIVSIISICYYGFYVLVGVLVISIIAFPFIQTKTDRKIKKIKQNGTLAMAEFVSAEKNENTTRFPMYEIMVSYVNLEGQEVSVKLLDSFVLPEVDYLKRKGKFKIKFIDNEAASVEEIDKDYIKEKMK